eukprot:UC1_evm1s640
MSSGGGGGSEETSLVEVWVYDLSHGMAAAMSEQLIGKRVDGIWHTAVVVYGHEIYFGNGITRSVPGTTPAGRPVRRLKLGHTEVPKWLLEEQLAGMRAQFSPEHYHLLDHNCNTFAHELAQFLTGKGLPEYILDLPRDVQSTPLGAMMRPMIDALMRGGSNP